MSKLYFILEFIISGTKNLVFFTMFIPVIFFANTGYDLEEFEDLDVQSLDKQKKRNTNFNEKQKLILFDDNLYLLDDDFDFGEDEFELQKLEIDQEDIETAREYEDFLNAFFENSTPIGTKSAVSSRIPSNQSSSKSKIKKSKSTKTPRTTKNTPQFSQNRPSRGNMGFGVSTIIGATMPVTMAGFSTGSNFGIRIDTPISFNLAGMEAVVGTDIYFSSFSGTEYESFNITNFVANISLFPISSVEFRTGLGLTPLSIGDYSDTGLSIPVDINYYLPFNFSGFKFAVNLHAQRTLGYPPIPGADDDDATDFLYLGLLINTPLAF